MRLIPCLCPLSFLLAWKKKKKEENAGDISSLESFLRAIDSFSLIIFTALWIYFLLLFNFPPLVIGLSLPENRRKATELPTEIFRR